MSESMADDDESYEQLPDNFVELVDELSRPIVLDDGVIIPPAIRPASD